MPLALRQLFDAMARHFPGHTMQRVLYPDGRIRYTYASPGMSKLGLDPETLLAEDVATHDWVHPDDAVRWRAALRLSAETLEPLDEEIRVIGDDHRVRWVRSIGNPRRLPSGAVVWDGIALDVTDKREALEAMRAARAEAEAAHAARSRFVATAHASLQAPLDQVRHAIGRLAAQAGVPADVLADLAAGADQIADGLDRLMAGRETAVARADRRALLVEPQPLVRAGLRHIVARSGVGTPREAASLDEALEQGGAADLVLVADEALAPDLPDGIARLAAAFPDAAIVVLAAGQDAELARAALESGARGVLARDAPPATITSALSIVLDAGETYVPPFALVGPETASRPLAGAELGLTGRQAEVLTLLGQGLSNRDIAQSLGLSEGTAKLHVAAVLKRLGLRNRTEAALIARRIGPPRRREAA